MDLTSLSPYAVAGAAVLFSGALACEACFFLVLRDEAEIRAPPPATTPPPPPPLPPPSSSDAMAPKTHAQREQALLK
jgi:hypothetical protein